MDDWELTTGFQDRRKLRRVSVSLQKLDFEEGGGRIPASGNVQSGKWRSEEGKGGDPAGRRAKGGTLAGKGKGKRGRGRITGRGNTGGGGREVSFFQRAAGVLDSRVLKPLKGRKRGGRVGAYREGNIGWRKKRERLNVRTERGMSSERPGRGRTNDV